MFNSSPQFAPGDLPETLPAALPQPKFRLGELVQWQAVPQPDFGQVIGVFYTHAASHWVTGLHYLILLADRSPSRTICTHDFAFEDDLESLELPSRPE